jgi:Zn ribbon nucleic-acid-binding protein
MSNNVHLSNGKSISRSVFERRITLAKAMVLNRQIEAYGYNFCVKCKQNDCIPVQCSHNVSVKECVESGKAELAYDINNIEPVGHYCHRKKDGLDLKFKNN